MQQGRQLSAKTFWFFFNLARFVFEYCHDSQRILASLAKFFPQIAFCNTIVPLNRYQSRHPARARAPLPLPHMLFWQDKSLQNPFPAPYFKRRISLKRFRFPQALTRGISFPWGDRATSDRQEKLWTGGGVCKNLSFSHYFQHDIICIQKSAKCMGLGPKSNECILHERLTTTKSWLLKHSVH